ncbi:MAG TPA: 4-hydroxythreonine-4-phosphate dehydrogenase PdxA [Xanthomonadales bacterium]|nr:4-hydroxythreonine-4-phosphate dehydrogenase PdxA [Xanthomonadales bacterium]
MSARPHPLRLALTPGEPAGIGPELAVMLAQREYAAELVAFADPQLLHATAERLGLPLALSAFDPSAEPRAHEPGRLVCATVAIDAPVVPGKLDTANARYVLEALRRAGDACLGGLCNALVTGPVHKANIAAAGWPFTGHTEFLAGQAGTDVVMMLATPTLRVALATTHIALRDVPDAITHDGLVRDVRIVAHDLRTRFGIDRPRIAVLGLNPHAGESGLLGREEIDTIGPALATLRGGGIDARGPLPADTAFVPAQLGQVDAVFAMYHDQGLPVLKAQGFGEAVNVTLGLPYLRTSVDHGTALDIAGTGRADPSSLAMAVEFAIRTLNRPQGGLPQQPLRSP